MTINLLSELNDNLIYFLISWINYFTCIAGGRDDAKLSIPATVILRNMFSPAEIMVIHSDCFGMRFNRTSSVALVPLISFSGRCFSMCGSKSQDSTLV